MRHSILIIDDEELQASNLAKALSDEFPEYDILHVSKEHDIHRVIVSHYYSVALVDLRMDGYSFDGFDVIDWISEINPYAKIIAVSAYTDEYMMKLSSCMSEGKLLAISEKDSYEMWIPKLKDIISEYYVRRSYSIVVKVLEESYANAKNEQDSYKKGVMFEDFIVNLFRQMGFIHIETRKKDSASNEVDLIIRNDIEDPFFNKFGRYIFVECKNKPEIGFDKNDFIVFNNKVLSSSGNCDLGIVFTTGDIKKTVYKEALKESKFDTKIVFLSSAEILRLIHTPRMIDEFKEIIDSQVIA